MYILDLFKSLGKKENLPVVVYLLLNVFVISAIINIFAMASNQVWSLKQSLGLGLILYSISLMIALSPVGEFILRLQTGCRRIRNQELKQYIEPIFNEVYEKVKQNNPTVSNHIKLFMCDDDSMNAFATGRNTICITSGLLKLSKDEIQATLAHEFGHLLNKDTDLILVVYVGNLIVSGAILLIRFVISLIYLFFNIACMLMGGKEGNILSIITSLYHLAITLFVAGLIKIWTWIGTLLVMKSSRDHEYLADEFSAKLGYKEALCQFLSIVDDGGKQGLFASLVSTHPQNMKRIERLNHFNNE